MNKCKNLSKDELIARKLLNICSNNLEVNEDFLEILDSIKYRHILLALKMIDGEEVMDMVLFEYLIENIKNGPEYIDEEEVYL